MFLKPLSVRIVIVFLLLLHCFNKDKFNDETSCVIFSMNIMNKEKNLTSETIVVDRTPGKINTKNIKDCNIIFLIIYQELY